MLDSLDGNLQNASLPRHFLFNFSIIIYAPALLINFKLATGGTVKVPDMSLHSERWPSKTQDFSLPSTIK